MNSVKHDPKGPGFPIRKSPDQRLLSPPRSLSQSATSFIASTRQGIHQMPLSRLISFPVMHSEQTKQKPRPKTDNRRPRTATPASADPHTATHMTATRKNTLRVPRVHIHDRLPSPDTRHPTRKPNPEHRRIPADHVTDLFTMTKTAKAKNKYAQTAQTNAIGIRAERSRQPKAPPGTVPRMVEVNGIEPMTSCLQSRRSPN